MDLLLISTISCVLEYVMPIVIKYIVSRVYAKTKQDVELQNDLINIKKEMAGISMVDEFSKYAKLQRKCNKIESVLTENATDRSSSKIKIQFYATFGFRILNGLFILVLLYLYKSKPVIILPNGTLWPLQSVLSWPCYQEDSISLPMWIAITMSVVSMYGKVNIT